jgi:hypothetical protein
MPLLEEARRTILPAIENQEKLKPPTALFAPGIVWRALRHLVRR